MSDYNDGREAFDVGKSKETNPYGDIPDGELWLKGWEDAKNDLKKDIEEGL